MNAASAVSAVSTTNARPLLSVDEAASMLCLSARFVRVLLARGDLPVVRLGRRTLIRRTDVEDVIARGGLQKAAG